MFYSITNILEDFVIVLLSRCFFSLFQSNQCFHTFKRLYVMNLNAFKFLELNFISLYFWMVQLTNSLLWFSKYELISKNQTTLEEIFSLLPTSILDSTSNLPSLFNRLEKLVLGKEHGLSEMLQNSVEETPESDNSIADDKSKTKSQKKPAWIDEDDVGLE